MPKLRRKYQAWRIVLLAVIFFWAVGPVTLWAISRTSATWIVAVGIPLHYGGVLVITVGAIGALYLFRTPLRARATQLRTRDNTVFCVTLDPLWTPLTSPADVELGPGFLIADREGIRIVDDSEREILVAAWDDIDDVRPGRAPKPIAVIQLGRGGETSEWWFYVLGPGAFLRRGRHGIDRFVKRVRSMRPGARDQSLVE